MAYNISDNEIFVISGSDNVTIVADQINSLKSIEQVSYLGDELVYDTLSLEARQTRTINANGTATYGVDLTPFIYGASMEHSNNDFVHTFYLESSNQVGKYAYQYDCVSIIGVLDRQVFGGCVVNRTYFSTLLTQIVGASGTIFDYTCANVANILVSGWIPYGTKRDALQQLLFATNVHALWDETNQRVVFDYIDHTVAGTIADANIFDSGKVEHPQLATRVSVTEHSFFAYTTNSSMVTVFDNSTGYSVSSKLVKFSNAPIIPSSIVTTGNLVVTDVTSDSAVVTGRGTIQAYPYIHTTFDVVRDYSGSGRKDYEISVTNAYLVSVLNSENVADRLADYYFNRYVVKADIKVTSEQCGYYYTLKDAFSQARTGFLQKMEKTFSSFLRAACEFLCGVTADYESNTFTKYLLLYYDSSNVSTHPQSGTWTVPTGVIRIRVTLIGGGTGGSSGIPGSPGDTSGNGGNGGGAGTPGDGGKIYEFTLDVTPGETFAYYLGTGGAGGAQLPYATYQNTQTVNAGTAGEDTTFTRNSDSTVYSSANGVSSENGWYFLATSNVLGQKGDEGQSGGDGGNAGESSDVAAETEKRNGSAGAGVEWNGTTFAGGSGGSGTYVTAPTTFELVDDMDVNDIYNTGVYVHANGTTSLVTAGTGLTYAFCQSMHDYANGAITYCNVLGWTHEIGIGGGGGGGGALGGTGANGAAGQNLIAYPQSVVIDQENLLRDDDKFCWHELNTTYGGHGGAGASALTFTRSIIPGKGGNAGWGGGGGGGAAASRTASKSVAWLMSEYQPSSTVPTGGAGGNGGAGQQGSYGGIAIYMT